MNSFNAYMLSVFAKNERFGVDVASLHRRFQVLSLIYVHLAADFMLFAFFCAASLFFNSPPYLILLIVILTLSTFSALNQSQLTIASLLLLAKLHISNFVVSHSMNLPLVALFPILVYPILISFLSPSIRVHILNALLCAVDMVHNAIKIYFLFQETVSTEQLRQVHAQMFTAALIIPSICATCVVQKLVESNAWRLAQENHIRSEKLTNELVQAVEAKDSFVSMLSHEMRNPLNSLKGSVDYLLQVTSTPDQVSILQNARLSGEILLNLVNNMLDAAKLKAEKMDIIYMETNVMETIKKVFTINSEFIKEKELGVKAVIDKNLPRFLWLDPSRLLQILMNLVSNAIKFTPKGGEIRIYAKWCLLPKDKQALLTPITCKKENINEKRGNNSMSEPPASSTAGLPAIQRGLSIAFDEFSTSKECRKIMRMEMHSNDLNNILQGGTVIKYNSVPWKIHQTKLPSQETDESIDAEREKKEQPRAKGYLKIQVLDTGCGVNQEDLQKLFGMFAQGKDHTRSVNGGVGLGLWICKQLCQKMNGDITLYSKHNEGTSFVFYIPVNNDRIANLPARASGNKIRALVVDDYSINRYLHKMLLEQEGIKVAVACDGKEAFEKYKVSNDEFYDFILMDIHMPVLDGFNATKKIREWEKANNRSLVDIYFVSGEYFDEKDVLSEFKSKGGALQRIRCLRKPLASDMVKSLVSKYK